MTRRQGFRLLLIACCVAGAVHTVVLGSLLIYPDLNLGYPFMGGDSYDWISQALRFSGADVRYPGRPPLLPLVMAALEGLSLLELMPVLLQLLIALTTVVLYRVVAGRYSRPIALAVSTAFFLNYAWRSLGVEIMADVPAACLMLMALAAFSEALERPRYFVIAGLTAGLSAITQPISLLLLVPMGAAMYLFKRGDLRSRWPWIGLTLFTAPSVMWIVVRQMWIGSAGAGPLHWQLLGLHLDLVPFYLWTGIAFVGVPGFLLAALGLCMAVRRINKDPWPLVLVASTLLVLGFFSLAYGFAAKRFLVYAFVLAPFLWAEGLNRCRRPKAEVVVSLVLIAWSWLPYPDRGSSPLKLALWPLPATYLATSADQSPRGDVRPDFSDVRIEHPNGLHRWLVPVRAWSAKKRPLPATTVEVLESDHAAVFLSRLEVENSRRYVTVTRLGNALKRRVKFVSRQQLQPFIDRLPLTEVGRILDWQIFRSRLPGLDATWLVTFSSDEVPQRGGSVNAVTGESNSIDLMLQTAQELTAMVPVNDDVVVVLTEPGSNDQLLTYLTFLAPSTNLYIITSDDFSTTLNDLGCGDPALFEQASEIVVGTCNVLGYPATVIRLP